MTQPGRLYGGRYEVTGPIASGGMAEVFMARDRLLGRPVALKVLHPEFARDRAFIERFRREAQAAASLNDPRVVSIFDWGSDDGTYYIVMEYVQGKSLRELIDEEGPFTPERAVEIAMDTCAALHFAHRHGIVHRDVKPANVMIARTGQTKVMDFGIARAARDAGATVTQTGTVLGTASYLSPEQAQGMPVDARSDVYAAGVLLYEMLTREVPFKADTPVAIAYKHVKEEAVPPSRLNREVPPQLDAIVLKALAKNPENRYQSAEEMRQDLQRVLRGQPVEATPLLPPDQTVVGMPPTDRTVVMPAPTAPPAASRRKALAYVLVLLMFAGILVAGVALLFSLVGGGVETVEVPKVQGKALPDAERALEAAGLDGVVERTDFSETVPEGSVISQDPEDGFKVPRGSKVRLVVSKGLERVDVPDLTGKTREEATAMLEKAGLRLGSVQQQFSADVEQGKILSQDPASGQKVERGRSVNVAISAGQEMVRMRDVTKISEEQARQRILDLGLNPVVKDACDVNEKPGTVLAQSPGSGEEVPKGSDVTITVNRARTVPPVVGLTEADAVTRLEEAGFKAKVEYQTRPVGSNRVVRQSPEAGEVRCAGETVTITVERSSVTPSPTPTPSPSPGVSPSPTST